MKQLINFFEKNPYVIHLAAVVLIFPALFINLGLMPLRFDGAFRGLIAYEMILSGDYLTPTINGEMYFNKPPLYNWLLVLFFKATGIYNEFIIRLPMILSYIVFGLSIYLVLFRDIGKEKAFVHAMVFMTGGCMFFGLSSVGHIDFTLGFLVYLAIMNMYYQYRRKRLLLLFTVSYFLTALGFLIKGLPALAFLGISLLVFFIYMKDWKKLFRWQHVAGILVFLVVTGAYYVAYFMSNPGYFDMVFDTLFREALIKSSVGSTIMNFIVLILIFPFKVLYNLLPWALFVAYFFSKGMKKAFSTDPLLKFSALIFIFNLLIYWVSSGTQMKYLIPIFPFIFYVLVELYFRFREDKKKTGAVHAMFFIITLILMAGTAMAPFLGMTANIRGIEWISPALFVVFGALAILFNKTATLRIQVFILVLIVARIGFNLIVQPVNVASLNEVQYKKDAIEVGRMTKGDELILCTTINEDVSFYISRERGEVLPVYREKDYVPGVYYIFDAVQVNELTEQDIPYTIYYEFACEFDDKELFLSMIR